VELLEGEEVGKRRGGAGAVGCGNKRKGKPVVVRSNKGAWALARPVAG
jgi:hypothetical protein